MKGFSRFIVRRFGARGLLFAFLFGALISPQARAASNVGSEVTINTPTNGQTVSGNAVAVSVTLGSDVYWDQLMVDGTSVLSGDGNFTWNSATVANGTHRLTVRVFQKGGTSPLGTAYVSVVVNNSEATPTAHFSTLSGSAPLPTDSQCAAIIHAKAETVWANTPFNQTKPTSAQLSSYAANGYTSTFQDDYTQYKRVDGQYTGSTDMIARWAACKYGIDEDVVRAQGWIESGWRQGGGGDKRTVQSECVQGSFTALWNTTIYEPGGSTVSCPNCCYQSWSLWQTKVYYEWMTWPEIMQSTAFGADYRYADQRACMDGAYTTYYASSAQQPNTYATDIANYKANSSTTNTGRVLWGCVGMHFSGSWYDSGAQTYISEVQNALVTKPWPE
jgi:autotransporter family porin